MRCSTGARTSAFCGGWLEDPCRHSSNSRTPVDELHSRAGSSGSNECGLWQRSDANLARALDAHSQRQLALKSVHRQPLRQQLACATMIPMVTASWNLQGEDDGGSSACTWPTYGRLSRGSAVQPLLLRMCSSLCRLASGQARLPNRQRFHSLKRLHVVCARFHAQHVEPAAVLEGSHLHVW